MLNFRKEMQEIFNQVKTEYEQQPFIPIDYPPSIDDGNWKLHENSIVIPKVKGQLLPRH